MITAPVEIVHRLCEWRGIYPHHAHETCSYNRCVARSIGSGLGLLCRGVAVIVYDARDDSRHAGFRWCEQHGIDPTDVRRVEDHGAYADVTFIARNEDGKPYFAPGTEEIAVEVRRVTP